MSVDGGGSLPRTSFWNAGSRQYVFGLCPEMLLYRGREEYLRAKRREMLTVPIGCASNEPMSSGPLSGLCQEAGSVLVAGE